MENRRKNRRRPLVSSIEIFSKDKAKSLGKGYVTNLHQGGLGLITPQDLSLGDEIILDFNLPNGWKLDFFGKVIYAEKAISSKAYGVEFLPGQATFILNIV